MPSIARVTDPISCTDTIAQGSPNVFINNLAATRQNLDLTRGHNTSPPTKLATGLQTVMVNNLPLVHVGDAIVPHSHTGYVVSGSPDVFGDDINSPPPPAAVALLAAMDAFKQPAATRTAFAAQITDDQGTDPINNTYQQYVDRGTPLVTETAVETAEPAAVPPAQVPSDCTDIMSHTGSFPGSFQLSSNFTLAQLTTNTLVSNYPVKAQVGLTEAQVVCNLRALCINVLEPMKAKYGASMCINSGFRHGTGTSQHYRGQACDVSFSDVSTATDQYNRAKDIKDTFIYDQYIYEQNNSIWHHVSYTTGTNRRAVLTKPRGNTYLAGLSRIVTV